MQCVLGVLWRAVAAEAALVAPENGRRPATDLLNFLKGF
jgi:hypothetical protein